MASKKKLLNSPPNNRPKEPIGLTNKARAVWKGLDYTSQGIYALGVCQGCKNNLTKERLSKCIEEKLLPMCPKDWAQAQSRIQTLAPMFAQLKLL